MVRAGCGGSGVRRPTSGRGFEPWQEKLHLNLFYQRVVTDKDLKPTELGITIKPLRLAAILKSAPMLPQSLMYG